MRIIYDIEQPVQIGAGAHTYRPRVDVEDQEYLGFRVEYCISIDDGEALYIQGDSRHIRSMLTQMVSILDLNEEYCAKQFSDWVGEVKATKQKG